MYQQPICFNGKCITYYTAFLFVIAAVYSLQSLGVTHPVTILLGCLTLTSVLQHSKTFKSKGDSDWIITVDQFLARILPFFILYYFYSVLDLYIFCFVLFVVFLYIYNRCYLLDSYIDLASFNHALIPVFTVSLIIIIIRRNQY